MEAGVAEECVTRMRVELNRRGFEVGDKKVRRMMGVMGIICIYLQIENYGRFQKNGVLTNELLLSKKLYKLIFNCPKKGSTILSY